MQSATFLKRWGSFYIFLGIFACIISSIHIISRFHDLSGFDPPGGSLDLSTAIVIFISGSLILKGAFKILIDPRKEISYPVLGSIALLVTITVIIILWIGDIIGIITEGEIPSTDLFLEFPLSLTAFLGLLTLISLMIFSEQTGFFRSGSS